MKNDNFLERSDPSRDVTLLINYDSVSFSYGIGIIAFRVAFCCTLFDKLNKPWEICLHNPPSQNDNEDGQLHGNAVSILWA